MPLYEKLQELYQELLLRLRKKGEERLTIMIIPHGQEKMFSLQLNWYTILFLVGTLCLAVFLAFYGIYLKHLHEREMGRLQTLYGSNFQAALRLTESAGEIRAIKYELADRLTTLSEALGIPEHELSILPDGDQADAAARARLNAETFQDAAPLGPRAEYLPPVYALKSLNYLLAGQRPLLASVQEAIQDGIGVYSDMPIGRPFRDFRGLTDTSSYGVRINPVTGVGFEFHTGYDTSGPLGSPVYATGPGQVYRVYDAGNGYGRAVIIQHRFGLYSMFAHLNRVDVRQGETVYRGQRIGGMGRTGRATGIHLHYEIWSGTSERIDPEPFVCSVDFETARCQKFHRQNEQTTF
jgi:murein DD-endopeptidase MepM/ murein hydrolase activator NlpD